MLKKFQATFILKQIVIVGEVYFRISVFSSFPSISLLNMLQLLVKGLGLRFLFNGSHLCICVYEC
jgi:hypothetical protein